MPRTRYPHWSSFHYRLSLRIFLFDKPTLDPYLQYQSSHQNGKPETPHLPKRLPKRDVGRQLPLGLVVLECFRNLAISNQEVVSPFLPLFEIALLKFRKLKFWKRYHLKYIKFLNHGLWSEPPKKPHNVARCFPLVPTSPTSRLYPNTQKIRGVCMNLGMSLLPSDVLFLCFCWTRL